MATKINKPKPWRSKKYTDWVKNLYCSASMQPADDPHHITGLLGGGTGTKTHDLFTMPLTRENHTELHSYGHKQWETMKGTVQAEAVLRTINKALNDGVIEIRWTGDK